MSAVTEAYSATAAAWDRGPGRIYDRLASEMVVRCPGGVGGRLVLDIGAGRGAAERAARAAGARAVIGVDPALGMLTGRTMQVGGDAVALPFATASFDVAVAAFSITHLTDPAAGLGEAARVLRPAGALLVSAYADDDDHPAKQAVDAACRAAGWAPAPWYEAMRRHVMSTPAGAASIADAAGLLGARAERVEVRFGPLGPGALIDWRLGMAQLAPFVTGLDTAERAALRVDALRRLGGEPPPLRRRMILLSWQRS